jgi:eukaryotic translation initiation factor 2C
MGMMNFSLPPLNILTLSRRKFAVNNKDRPLKAWGVCCLQGRGAVPRQQVETFFQKFVQIYESHGGIVMAHPQHGKKPWMGSGNLADGGEMIKKVWNQTGNR